MTKYWVGAVSKEHVLLGVEGGFCQVCHGKGGPLKRMKSGDYLLYYSSKVSMQLPEKYQAFTAVGKMVDDRVYQFQMTDTFIPYRRDVNYYPHQKDCPIEVVRQHPEWLHYAKQLSYGHFEVSKEFFMYVFKYMK